MEPESKLALGVDIGGTKVAAGLVDAQGEIRTQMRTPMITEGAPDKGLEAVAKAVDELLERAGGLKNIAGIGICAPGPLNPITGVIINPPNLPIWHNYPLAEEVRRRYGVGVRIDNDANAAALAEVKWGAARGHRNVFYATIGTGIGTGIVFDGKIYHGRTGAAGEGGHVGIDMNGTRCNCGKLGCIEALASGHVLDRAASLDLDDIALKIGAWLGSIVSLLDPDIVVIGGGVSKIGAPLFDRLRAIVPHRTINPHATELPIVPAQFGSEAGVLGAASVMLAT